MIIKTYRKTIDALYDSILNLSIDVNRTSWIDTDRLLWSMINNINWM